MASPNRYWPSMFKSRHCNAHHLRWQHDVNPFGLLSGSCHITEERVPEPETEPKPRWNLKPEQIRILEAIFNSGMVNPPRDEIRRIRAQIQEYRQVVRVLLGVGEVQVGHSSKRAIHLVDSW